MKMSEPLNPYYQIDVLNDKYYILSVQCEMQQKQIEHLLTQIAILYESFAKFKNEVIEGKYK